jgi:acetolactate synthase I/II/III large subunit
MGMPRAADVIVERLVAHGTRRVFAVAGESYLDVLDAFYNVRDALQVVTCRHEAAAAHMAEASGKLNAQPGVAFVTRGPGLTHASIGVHTAQQDATPMLLFVGEIARADRFRRAFQEVNLLQTFGDLAKSVLQLDLAERAGELVDRAFQLSVSGRPGPIVIGLPEDVLSQECTTPNAAPRREAVLSVSPVLIDQLAARLSQAQRPLLWVGGSQWTRRDVAALQQLAEAWDLPVVTAFRRKDLFPNDHRCYAGEMGLGTPQALVQRVRDADTLLVLGAALGDVETGGYQRLDRASTAARLLHVHVDSQTLGAFYPAQLALAAPPGEVAAALALLAPTATPARTWAAWTQAASADQSAFMQPVSVVGEMNLSVVFRTLRASLPPTAIICNGAGNYSAWLHRFYSHSTFPTQLAPGSGAMGYAVPAAIAAKLALPEQEVVCVAGDGCFLMSAQELATVAALRLRILFLIVNNGTYGTIRMHQEARFPGRRLGTALVNPDFVALGRAYGLAAWRVTSTDAFPAAFSAARSHAGPALIELVTSIEDIAPGRRLKADNLEASHSIAAGASLPNA